ncbi:Protoglobin-domain-containing protein [Gymnopilus junonius]|uniref:Protoglobin-domain-containing protein n=1 Tax=Gymnopilus junonius TaxID=109634 RepID=A0A9P5NC33_GYMJU|nr:Protoglobin-domain-containing protein [Gymnopilus junonius]
MEHISEAELNDLQYRVQYLRKFIDFTEKDAAALHAARDVVAPLVPAVVDAVYTKLLSFDITSKSFVPRQTGYNGEAPANLSDLSLTHPQIAFRKDFLAGYLKKLVTMDYSNPSSWEYLDKVGLMHTGQAGFAHRITKPALRVEYIHCAILLGYVEDILVNAVVTHPDLDLETKNAVARAANKIIWIQNDLFARHYLADETLSIGTIPFKKPTLLAVAAGLLGLGILLGRFSRT